MAKFFILILLVILLTALQSFGFSIFNIKPNLALAGIITASFFIVNGQWSMVKGLLLVALAALILKFAPGFESEILTFSLIGAGAVLIKKYLPWQYFFSNLILIIFGTFIFYLFLAANLIPTLIFFKELALNLITGTLMFAVLNFLWQNKI
jgi:hypothetical protein